MSQPGSADSFSFFSRWLVLLFDCLGHTRRSGGPADSQGVERELNISHHQPHLVPPMKLVFYDEMPISPAFPPTPAHRVSHWVAQGRDLASKASDRASLTIRRKLSKQNISAPMAVTNFDHLPLRRQHFRPLELSIYLPGNRLSDLPEFQDLEFTSEGEIQVPPKALIRTRSEDMLQSFPKPPIRPIMSMSMVGERQLDYWQPRPTSPTTQRPPSASEALNSHPVYWHSLPGLPSQDAVVKILSPMAEEEEPISTPRTAENMILEFPPVKEQQDEEEQLLQQQQYASSQPNASITPPPSIQIPYKKPLCPDPGPLNPFRRTRVSQWLSRSSFSFSSSSTTRTTSSSLLETQRSQFYQCAISPPPLHHHHPSLSQTEIRKRSTSISTLASSTASPAESLASMTSMTTAPTTIHAPRSRSGTLRSVGKHVAVVIGEGENLPEMPHVYAQLQEEGGSVGKGMTTRTGPVRDGEVF